LLCRKIKDLEVSKGLKKERCCSSWVLMHLQILLVVMLLQPMPPLQHPMLQFLRH